LIVDFVINKTAEHKTVQISKCLHTNQIPDRVQKHYISRKKRCRLKLWVGKWVNLDFYRFELSVRSKAVNRASRGVATLSD